MLETQLERGRVSVIATVNGTVIKLLPWSRTVTLPSASGLAAEVRLYKSDTSFVTTKRTFDAQFPKAPPKLPPVEEPIPFNPDEDFP